jgi:hypothetical protein
MQFDSLTRYRSLSVKFIVRTHICFFLFCIYLVKYFFCAEDEVLNLVIEYDVNGDGTIDFDEFLGRDYRLKYGVRSAKFFWAQCKEIQNLFHP